MGGYRDAANCSIPLQTVVTSASPVFRAKNKDEWSAGKDCRSLFYYVAAHFANYIYETFGLLVRRSF